jgi:hypothetical protein
MSNTTMNRKYSPGGSPLLGIAAVAATALTIGVAVLLPAKFDASGPVPAATAQAQRMDAQSPVRVVTLPAVEVVATRPAKTASIHPWNLPVVLKQKS